MPELPKRNSPRLEDLLRQRRGAKVLGKRWTVGYLDRYIEEERVRCVRAEASNPTDEIPTPMHYWVRTDEYAALESMPRLADGAIAYPGRKIWRLHTTDGGRTWTTIPLTISTINRMGDIKCGDQSLWVTNPDLRHYGTREAAEADIPNHVVKPTYEAIKLHFSDGWIVESIASEDEIFATRFTGPDAEERAREYARWKNG